ncbi:MAG: glycosyltransferase family 9 protein [Candidatus Omnitrophica bacterium]|nr:glycosyltransferase family 9 protein [Candidatus Omnitrophota bacterium]
MLKKFMLLAGICLKGKRLAGEIFTMNEKIKIKPNARILITRSDRIGDLVLSTPVFAVLRRHFPQAWIAGLTFQENRQILEGNPYLNEVILYDKKGSEKGWWGNYCFARQLAKKKFNVAVHLHATNRMHVVSRLAGIPIRIGYGRKAAWALTHVVTDDKSGGLRHEAEYNFNVLEPLGTGRPALNELELYFPVCERDEKSLNELLAQRGVVKDKPWLVLHPSASCPSKIWPAESFGRLSAWIQKEYDAEIFVVGMRCDRKFHKTIQQQSLQTVHDLCGRLSLGMLGALLKKSDLLISNDSGPVHIANAVGTPVISIFGRNQPGLSPKRWGPLSPDSQVIWKDVGCHPCLAHECQINFLCLEAVGVNEVMESVKSYASKFCRPAAGERK